MTMRVRALVRKLLRSQPMPTYPLGGTAAQAEPKPPTASLRLFPSASLTLLREYCGYRTPHSARRYAARTVAVALRHEAQGVSSSRV